MDGYYLVFQRCSCGLSDANPSVPSDGVDMERNHYGSRFFILLLLLALVLLLRLFIGTLSGEAFDFYQKTRDSVSLAKIEQGINSDSLWARQVRKWGEMTGIELSPENIRDLSSSIGKKVGLFLYKQISSVASNLLSFLVHFFLMMLTIYYLFNDGNRLMNYVIELLPVPREQLEKVVGKFQEMGRAIFLGNGLSGSVQGVLGGIGFYLFGLESPLLWGTVIAFMAFLPVIGASVVFIPAAVILFLHGKTSLAVGFLFYNLLYSSVVEYIVKPRIIGKGMQLNSLLVFIGIIGGIKLFGILGIIYGPLIITIFITMAEIFRLEYKEKPI